MIPERSDVPVRSARTLDLLLLTWASGTMDALSYLAARAFTANMTGNTVLLGLAIIGPDRSRLQPCIISLSAFSIGVLLGGATLRRKVASQRDARRNLRIGVLLELPFVITFALLLWLSSPSGLRSTGPMLISAGACALGIQSVAVRRLKISGVVTTFITGTITTAIVSLAKTADTRPALRRAHDNSPGVLALMFLLYIVAAALAAWLMTNQHEALAALIPLTSLSIVLLRTTRGSGRSAV